MSSSWHTKDVTAKFKIIINFQNEELLIKNFKQKWKILTLILIPTCSKNCVQDKDNLKVCDFFKMLSKTLCTKNEIWQLRPYVGVYSSYVSNVSLFPIWYISCVPLSAETSLITPCDVNLLYATGANMQLMLTETMALIRLSLLHSMKALRFM